MPRLAQGLCVSGLVVLVSCSDEPLIAQKVIGPMTMQNWTQQDQATNVQDWHRMAQKIADSMQDRGLLATTSETSLGNKHPVLVQHAFYVHSNQDTPFTRELRQALKTEILRRGGVVAMSGNTAQVVELAVNVVAWGSRVRSDPQRSRTEAIWSASINSQDRVIMSIQEPFYIFTADIFQYVQTGDPGQHLARMARPLLYIRSTD